MINKGYFLNLPPTSLNLLSGGVFVFVVCLGVRVARAPELGLKVANTQLVVGNSADKLEEVSNKLEQQAKVIEEKDKAYEQLLQAYEQSTQGVKNDRRIKDAIQTIEKIPEVESIDELQVEIQEAEENLIQLEGES